MNEQEKLQRHQQLVIAISDTMDQTEGSAEFENFKTALGGHLPKGVRSRCSTIPKLLDAMTTRGKIKPDKYDILKGVADDSGNLDLLPLIAEAERDMQRGGVNADKETKQLHLINTEEQNTIQTSSSGITSGKRESTPPLQMPVKKRMPAPASTSDDEHKDQADPLYKRKHGKGFYHTDGKQGYLLLLYTKTISGAAHDIYRLKQFFGGQLQFMINDPVSFRQSDLSHQDVAAELNNCVHALVTEPNKYYCFMCFILSHGNENGINTTTGQYTAEDIRKFFSNTNMPQFAGRPKLFFIDACRGGDNMRYTDAADNDSDMEVDGQSYMIPSDADVLIAHSTTPGYTVWYNDSGFVFTRHLVNIFQTDYEDDHVEEMMIKVREYTADTTIPDGVGNHVKQMPCTWSTLTNRLYLKPFMP